MKVFSKDIPANVRTFLALLMHTEGTDRYSNPYIVRYSGKLVEPNQPHDGKAITAGAWTSTAIGAYQFLFRTWKGLHGGANPPMTPRAQDLAAIKLIKQAGAYNDIIAGRWEEAIKKTNRIWASLPGSPYGQPTYAMLKVMNFIKKHGGAAAAAGLVAGAALFFF